MEKKFYEKIKWLENIGKEEVIYTIIPNKQILNIKDVEKHIKSDVWSDILLEAQNELSLRLANRGHDDSKWNTHVRKSKKIYSEQLEQLIGRKLKVNNINDSLKNDVKSDFILLFLLDLYKDKIDEHCFLHDILKVYEAGHLPCGWIGPVEEKGIPTIEESIRAVYNSDIDETYKKGTLLYY